MENTLFFIYWASVLVGAYALYESIVLSVKRRKNVPEPETSMILAVPALIVFIFIPVINTVTAIMLVVTVFISLTSVDID